jgi:hypothetical protein
MIDIIIVDDFAHCPIFLNLLSLGIASKLS